MKPLLIIQSDCPEQDASRTTKYLQYVILRQGVGIDTSRVIIDPPDTRAYEGVPVLTMGKLAMAPYMGGNTRIGSYHGHIQYVDGRIVGHTFDAFTAIKDPNFLPVIIQETSNLLRAASNPAVLDRPAAIRELPPYVPDHAVIDLEWDAKFRVTVVGFAMDGEAGYSTHEVGSGLHIARQMLAQGRTVIGHNVISADLPHIGKPRSLSPRHVFDTMIAAHIVHAHFAQLGLLDLGSLVRYYFPTQDWKHDKGDMLTYNSYDCAYNYRLYEALIRDLRITNQEHLMKPHQELHALTLLMRDRGIAVDGAALTKLVNEKADEKGRLKSNLPINPNSPKQIVEWLRAQKIFVNDCQAKTLAKLRGRSEEIDALIDFRVDNKSLTTWFEYEADKQGKLVSFQSRMHPKFNATGTNVDRLSSSEPNWQNLPPSVRHVIVPTHEDCELVAFDAAQGENRWVAFLAEDDVMLAGFDAGIDNHQAVADRISKVLGYECTRNFAKTVVHASNYGEKEFNLAERLFGNRKKESVAKAKALQDAYFVAYAKTRAWQQRIQKQIDSGDVKLVNPFGRVRFVYGADSHDRLKMGCHFLGCSSLADLVNRRAVEVYNELKLVPILIVHDELVYEVEKGQEKIWRQINEILTQPIPEMGGRRGVWDAKRGLNYGKRSDTNPNGLAKLVL